MNQHVNEFAAQKNSKKIKEMITLRVYSKEKKTSCKPRYNIDNASYNLVGKSTA